MKLNVCESVSPMRKLQKIAAGIPTVSQDTMVNNQEEARRRKAFSRNIAYRETNTNRQKWLFVLRNDIQLQQGFSHMTFSALMFLQSKHWHRVWMH